MSNAIFTLLKLAIPFFFLVSCEYASSSAPDEESTSEGNASSSGQALQYAPLSLSGKTLTLTKIKSDVFAGFSAGSCTAKPAVLTAGTASSAITGTPSCSYQRISGTEALFVAEYKVSTTPGSAGRYTSSYVQTVTLTFSSSRSGIYSQSTRCLTTGSISKNQTFEGTGYFTLN